jgi:hypothetical protein
MTTVAGRVAVCRGERAWRPPGSKGMSMRGRHLASIFALAGLAACGRLAGEDYGGQPLVALHGQVVSEAPLDPSQHVGLAFVWITSAFLSSSTAPAFVAQDVRVSAPFPSAFSLDVDDPPPAGARIAASGSGYFAVGMVVAYSDDDGNGHLDLPSSMDAAFPERILGTTQDRIVSFRSGSWQSLVPRGFSYLVTGAPDELGPRLFACFDGYHGDDTAFAACTESLNLRYEDIGAQITVRLHPDGDPGAACLALTGSQHATLDRVETRCDADRRGFTMSATAPSGAPSGSLLEACYASARGGEYTYRLPDTTPIPPSPWPC